MSLSLQSLNIKNTVFGATLLQNPTTAAQLQFIIAAIQSTFSVNPNVVGSGVATAGQFSLCWAPTANHNVVNGTPWVLDVTNLTDAAGNTVTFGHVNYFEAFNLSTTATDNIVVGTSGSNPLFGTDQITANANALNTNLFASGTARWLDLGVGYPVSGSAKNVQIASAAGTVPVFVIIAGRDT